MILYTLEYINKLILDNSNVELEYDTSNYLNQILCDIRKNSFKTSK